MGWHELVHKKKERRKGTEAGAVPLPCLRGNVLFGVNLIRGRLEDLGAELGACSSPRAASVWLRFFGMFCVAGGRYIFLSAITGGRRLRGGRAGQIPRAGILGPAPCIAATAASLCALDLATLPSLHPPSFG